MNIFSKKNTLTSNIAFMGIMTAFNVIFVLLSYFVPFLVFILIFFLPLTSLCVTLLCQKRYLIIYVVASVALCVLVTLRNFTDTLFYVIPSICSGITFGLIIEKKMPVLWGILLVSGINMSLSYLAIPVIKAIYEQDIIVVISKLFNLNTYPYLSYVIPAYILLVGLIESLFCYLVIMITLPKLGFELSPISMDLYGGCFGLVITLLTLLFVFILPKAYLATLLVASYFMIFAFVDLIYKKHKLKIAISCSAIAISIILLFALYAYIPEPLSLSLLLIPCGAILFVDLFDNYLLNKAANVK